MTDHMAADLAAANDAIDRLERRLRENDAAERHPRWTAGGELVLLGDFGTDPDGQEFTVLGLDILGHVIVLWSDDLGTTNSTGCHTLRTRQPIPPTQMEAIQRAMTEAD